jgi:hypothetical protein
MALTESQISCLGFNVSGDVAGLTIYTNRKGKKVFYEAAPPRTPPSVWVQAWRRNFKFGMIMWRSLSEQERENYRRVCDLASLCMLGHNLWLHAYLSRDHHVLEALSCRYQIPLRRPPPL